MRPFAILFAFVVSPWLAGCGDDTIQIAPQPLELDAEQAAVIRSVDQMVDLEEGGPQKVTRPARGIKTARKGG